MGGKSPFEDYRDKLSVVLDDYIEVNPEFTKDLTYRSRRASLFCELFFWTEEGLPRRNKEVEDNLRIFRARVMSIVEQTKDNPVWQKRLAKSGITHRVADSKEDYNKSPRTLAKTLQDIFTLEYERIAFSSSEAEEVKDLYSIMVDPTTINETVLRDLGMKQLVPLISSNKKSEMVEKAAMIIPEIKKAFPRIEPLADVEGFNTRNLRFFRLMRIAEGDNKGFVLGTQNIADKKRIFKTDLDGAYRRIDHIKNAYEREIRILTEMNAEIEKVRIRITDDWHNVKIDKDSIKKSLLKHLDTLQMVRSNEKRKLKNRIERAMNLKFARKFPPKYKTVEGKKQLVKPAREVFVDNPGQASALLATVPLLIEKRFTEMRRIIGYLSQDQMRVKAFIEKQEVPFKLFFNTVERGYEKFRLLHPERELKQDEKEKIIANLKDTKYMIDPIRREKEGKMFLEPYLTFAEDMDKYLSETISQLEQPTELNREQRIEIARSFTKAYLVAKIAFVHRNLMEFYRNHISSGVDTNFNAVCEDIETIYNIAREKRVPAYLINEEGQEMPNYLETPEFYNIFAQLYHLLNGLRIRSKEAAIRSETLREKPNDEKIIKRLRQEMRDKFKRFNIHNIIRSPEKISYNG
jgi:hypothetical protein